MLTNISKTPLINEANILKIFWDLYDQILKNIKGIIFNIKLISSNSLINV
jgi:hypothetical protein